MAQQPNIELTPGDRPRPQLAPAPARRWRASGKPGVITSPDEVPRGPSFGTPGPDTGWALRLVRDAGLHDQPDDVRAVLVALMAARASSFGRAPVPEDLRVAMAVCGLGDEGAPDRVRERAARWFAAVPHEGSKGSTAVAEVDRELLRQPSDRVRAVQRME